jgi:hypothetical protein
LEKLLSSIEPSTIREWRNIAEYLVFDKIIGAYVIIPKNTKHTKLASHAYRVHRKGEDYVVDRFWVEMTPMIFKPVVKEQQKKYEKDGVVHSASTYVTTSDAEGIYAGQLGTALAEAASQYSYGVVGSRGYTPSYSYRDVDHLMIRIRQYYSDRHIHRVNFEWHVDNTDIVMSIEGIPEKVIIRIPEIAFVDCTQHQLFNVFVLPYLV